MTRGVERPQRASAQQGVSLLIVTLVLALVSLLGLSAAHLALMAEYGARSERDALLAFQSAEAGLDDAVADIEHAANPARLALFKPGQTLAFVPGCAGAGPGKGLCAAASIGQKPAWLAVDFERDDALVASFGEFTGATPDSLGGPFTDQRPTPARYVIEAIDFYEPGQSRSGPPALAYRVTAMGFGRRLAVQSVVQMLYRKE